jgi:hypothetical protein
MASQYYTEPSSSNLLPNILIGLDHWFSRDYTQDACLDQGGLTNSTCPCGTPGLWNTNWFAQVIKNSPPPHASCLFHTCTLK